MIDRRKTKEKLEEKLLELSDTDIMLNFSDFLKSSYPYLLKIDAGCYNPFDDFVGSAYFEMVYSVFSYKYNIYIEFKQHHIYGMTLHTYRKIFHIEVSPKKFPFELTVNNEKIIFMEKDIPSNMRFIFISFFDGEHILCGPYDKNELQNMNFNKIQVDIIDKDTGFIFKKYKDAKISFDKTSVEYNFVIEDYDEMEHKSFKDNMYFE